MKEITTIVTLEITAISKVKDEQTDKINEIVAEHKTQEFARDFGESIKDVLGADDVNVTNIQDFVK